VTWEGGALSYGELTARAGRLARRLRRLGAGPGARVAIRLERSPELAVAVLAVLQSGAACVPLDPRYPAERLRFMLDDSGIAVLVNEESLAAIDAVEPAAQGPLPVPASGEDLAYILYTSGSTGRPKGVGMPRSALANLLDWQAREALPGPARTLQFASLSFDVSFQEIVSTWLVGGTLVLVSEETRRDPQALLAWIEAQEVERLFLPFVALRQLAETADTAVAAGASGPGAALRDVVTAGEALQVTGSVAAWLGARPGRRLHNQYGPTESHVVTAWTLVGDPGAWPALPPIGRPVANTWVHLLDPYLEAVPIGVVGELCIGGAGLARGYVDRPEATAERFVPDPWGHWSQGGRLYRTGDLARRRADGAIEYVGRRDAQVKVRGVRVEPGEVEAALETHPGVRQAVVAALPEPGAESGGPLRLIAWYLPAPGTSPMSPTPAELRDFLRQRLPEALVPSKLAAIESFPLTPSGKVDRRALTAPAGSGGSGVRFVPPRSEVEALLAGIWSGLLGVEQVGVHDSFFDLGGHSLLATQVMSRLRATVRVELPLRLLFEGPTVEQLARSVERALRERTGPAAPPLTARGLAEAPLSFAQQRLWFLHQLEPRSPAYNLYQALRLSGSLDEAALGHAMAELVRRQEALRTRFVLRGPRAVQVVSPLPAVVLAVVDLSSLPFSRREAEGEALARAEGRSPFDLERGPLLRVRLLRLAPGERLLLVAMHHIVSDAWSMEVFVRELAVLYAASPLPELPLQYADYAAWQREWLAEEVLAAELAWWRERLAGAPGVLPLPLDRPRPAVHTFAGARRSRRLPAALAEALLRLGRRLDATPFMVLLAFLDVLLLRHTGEEDLVVGSPVANRTRRETEGLIGFFVNTLALRTDLSGNPGFAEVVRRVRETALGAYTHQDLPFEKLVEELQPARSLQHTPLFQVMLVAETAPAAAPGGSGLEMEAVAVDNGTAKLDLTLLVHEGPDGLELGFGYNTDLFFATTIERLLDHGVALLGAVVADPARPVGDLTLLAAAERQQLLSEWNDTARAGRPDLCLHELFEAQAAERADAAAVLAGSAVLTYGELDRRADRLAGWLRERGIGPESRVAVHLPRSPEAVVAILAVLKAGGAYLPLDPSHPPERVAFQVRDAGAAPLLTSPLTGRNGEVTLAPIRPDLDSLAYVLYTSGSTGEPSGVLMPHRGAVNVVAQSRHRLDVGPGNRMLQIAPLGFDVSVGELFVALTSGAAVAIVGDEERQSPARLAEALARLGVDRAFVTPAFFAALPLEALPGLVASVGGEAFPRELAEHWVVRGGNGRRLLNNYGPTEAAVYATSHPVDPDKPGAPAIGRPIDGVSASLLDAWLQPVPIGVAGEICLGGAGLARGYLNRPEKTAERFVPHPFSGLAGERLYRTGDLGRLQPEGEIEILGRIDAQLKVRGYRIEPGEIEAALLRHPAVRQAAVVVRGEAAAERHLAAYVGAPAAPPEPAELRRFLAASLPEHMVPTVVVVLPALPLTANGKVDRRALPDPGRAAAGERALPATPLERFLAALWQEVLGRAEIGAEEDFFALGGTSLQAAVLIRLLEERFGEYVYVVALFEAPTVRGLARYLEGRYPEAVARVLGREAGGTLQGAAGRVGEAEIERFRSLLEPLPRRDPSRLRGPKNRRSLFLLSPPRSGSTLLRVMLAGHPALFAPPELELLGFNTLRERRAAFSGKYAFWAEGALRALMALDGVGAAEAAATMRSYEERDLSVRELYAELQGRLGGRLLVDKTPSYALDPSVLARAEEDFAAPLYLHLLRHPHGMIRSFTRARLDQVFFRSGQEGHPFAPRELAELIWVISQQNILEHLARVPRERQLALRFEDLVKAPEAELRRVCEFLGIAFDPAMLDPYAEGGERMTDGIHALSKMLGDVKFHEHRQVEAGVAESWRAEIEEDFLGEPAWRLAEAVGYSRPARPARPESPALPSSGFSPLVRLAEGGPGTPLFLVHPVAGNVSWYRELALRLRPDRPVYGLQALGLGTGEPQGTVEAMAATYLESVLAVQPEGPYLLGGWSIGGAIAWEMAQRLRREGRKVELLLLLDSLAPGRLGHPGDATIDPAEVPAGLAEETARRLRRVFAANLEAVRAYRPAPYPGRVLLVRAARRPEEDATLGWGPLAPGLTVEVLDTDHYGLLEEPAVEALARLLARSEVVPPRRVGPSPLGGGGLGRGGG
jgi:amino acid adenylation domain-containing protein